MVDINWRWHNEEKTILIFEQRDRWTWDDAAKLFETEMEVLDTVDHKVHIIIITEDNAANIPIGGNALNRIRDLMEINHKNEDLVFYVGKSMMIETFINIVATVNKLSHHTSRYHFVSTLEQALARIEEYEAEKL